MRDSPRPEVLTARQAFFALSEANHRSPRALAAFDSGEVEPSIPARFEEQVRRFPDRLAIRTRRHSLTYQALDQAANRVAHALIARRGPGAEPIALLLEHEAPLIVALLGVLKAGKFYVPLDPGYPRARTAAMLADAQAGLLITQESLLPQARELGGAGLELLNLDALEKGLSEESPELEINPDAYAYLLYTSGSTGQPKGVVENHRNVLHFTMTNITECGFGPDDRIPLFVSCCFSASASAIFGAVLTGASLHPLDVRQEGLDRLADWLISEEITIFHGGSFFHHVVGGLTGSQQFPHLRLIYYGGEPLSRRDVELFKQHFSPHCILVNQLGSCEMKCFRRFFIDRNTTIDGSIIPVGYAVEDTEILLLDEAGQPVAEGEVGEIAVRTRYLAPAYWRRPDLTAAAFRPDPDGSEARLYRTGDLGRLRPDGCLVCLGRTDAQVKVRGHRVELSEIEAALQSLAMVKEAAVTLRGEEPEEARLVAYLVAAGEAVPTVSRLRQALGERLPEYLIPSVYRFLAALPRNANGKVDRGQLPAPDGERPRLETPFVAPRTPLEARLARIWAEVLCLDRVGVHDQFLDLGGDSLSATRVISRAREAFSENLPLRLLFETPTVSEIASVIGRSLMECVDQEQLTALLTEPEPLTEAAAWSQCHDHPE